MDFQLKQRGRAAMDFEVAVAKAGGRAMQAAEAEMAGIGLGPDLLPEDMDERHRVIDEAMAGSSPFRLRALLAEYSARNHGLAALDAFAEIRDEVAPALASAAEGPTTIDYREGFEPPEYWARSWFHRSHGGWDAVPENGFVHGELIHRKFVSKIFAGDIYANRRLVAREAADRAYDRILELGTSSGHYTVALSEVFPEAEIWGIDPSPAMLEQARRVGNERGLDWKLFVGVGEDTGFEDASFDMVTAYAIHHELPTAIVDAVFAEAHRLLRPGGTVLIADVPRYADIDRLASWRFDWAARYGGEPFWRESAMMDFAAHAERAGFVEVRSGTVAPYANPYFVIGRKPR